MNFWKNGDSPKKAKKIYRKLMLLVHPDHGGSNDLAVLVTWCYETGSCLFTNCSTKQEAKKLFHELMHLVHPDHGGSNELTCMVKGAYESAKSSLPSEKPKREYKKEDPKSDTSNFMDAFRQSMQSEKFEGMRFRTYGPLYEQRRDQNRIYSNQPEADAIRMMCAEIDQRVCMGMEVDDAQKSFCRAIFQDIRTGWTTKSKYMSLCRIYAMYTGTAMGDILKKAHSRGVRPNADTNGVVPNYDIIEL